MGSINLHATAYTYNPSSNEERPLEVLPPPLLPPILPQLQTHLYSDAFKDRSQQVLPSLTGLYINNGAPSTVISPTRTDSIRRKSSSPIQAPRYSPYERPLSQKSSPTQRVKLPHRGSKSSPETKFRSPMRRRQEATAPPPFAPTNIYQPAPIALQPSITPKEEPRASSTMLISNIMNQIPTKPITELYSIRVRQQPKNARMCGNGLADRRHIDPPPVVQLFINDPSMSLDDIKRKVVTVHASLWNAETDTEERFTPDENLRLEGRVAESASFALDEDNQPGVFALFSDLSCRTAGHYRLHFALTIMNYDNPQGQLLPFMATAVSNVFKVSNATGTDKFRGMSESTRLTKALKLAGFGVKLRRGTAANTRQIARGSPESDEGIDVELRQAKNKRRKRGGKI